MTLRLLALAAVLLAGGCVESVVDGNRPMTVSTLAGTGSLTPQQHRAWKAVCNKMRNRQQDSLRLAVLTVDWHWQVRSYFVDADTRKSNYRWELAPGTGGDEKTIRTDASDYAKRAQFRCTAVLDLFGGDEPRFVSWYVYDGTSVKESATAPTPEIADSAQQYLVEAQRRARDIR